MLEKFQVKSLKNILFDEETPFKKVDDLWVFSISDLCGTNLKTIFYAEDGFRTRDEETGKYKQTTKELKYSYYSYYDDEILLEAIYNFCCRYYDELSEIFPYHLGNVNLKRDVVKNFARNLELAKDHGEYLKKKAVSDERDRKDRERFLGLGFDKFASLDQIKKEINNILKDRLILNTSGRVEAKRVIRYIPCGETYTTKDLATILHDCPKNLSFVKCPRCRKDHQVISVCESNWVDYFESNWVDYFYIKLYAMGQDLFAARYSFRLNDRLEKDAFVLEVSDDFEVLKIRKNYFGTFDFDYYDVAGNYRACECDDFRSDTNDWHICDSELVSKELEKFGDYGNKANKAIEYLLTHPACWTFARIFTDVMEREYSFLVKHELFSLLKYKENEKLPDMISWLKSHPEYIARVKNEDMSLEEGEVLKAYVDDGRKFSSNDLTELREFTSWYGGNCNTLYASIEELLPYAPLSKILKYVQVQSDGDFDLLKDYWRMLEDLPGHRMSDEKALFPKNLKREHDICDIECKLLREEVEKNRRKKKYAAIPKNWCDLFDQGYVDSNDEYVITPFESVDQIEEEGATQHICIGNEYYVTDYMNKKTMLCALRKKNDPETPYVAFEVRDNRLVQARAKYNAAPEDSALTYIHEYCHARGISA